MGVLRGSEILTGVLRGSGVLTGVDVNISFAFLGGVCLIPGNGASLGVLAAGEETAGDSIIFFSFVGLSRR